MDNNEINTLNAEDLEKITGGRTECPGFNCCNCHEFIPTTIIQIVTAKRIICPHCGHVYNIDRSKAGPAIEALNR